MDDVRKAPRERVDKLISSLERNKTLDSVRIPELLEVMKDLRLSINLDATCHRFRMGTWEIDLSTQRVLWSPITRSIHEVEKAYDPDLESALEFYEEGESRETIKQAVNRAMENGQAFDVQLTIITSRGNRRWVHAIGEVEPRGSKPRLVYGSIQDITERREAEQESQQYRRLLEEIAARADESIYIKDGHGRYFMVNEQFKRLFGIRYDQQVIGKTVYELLENQEEARELSEYDRQVMESGRSKVIEKNIQTRNGFRYFHINKFPMKNVPGLDEAMGGIVTDITERKRSEDSISESLSVKNAMLREIHHRVKNNLSQISSFLQLMSLHEDNEKVHRVLSDADLRVKSIMLIYESLYEAGQLDTVDCREYLSDLIQAIDGVLNCDNRIDIHVECDELQLHVNQAVPLALILNELLINAFKHAFDEDESGSIHVAIRKEGDTVTVRVRDSGRGFPSGFDQMSGEQLNLSVMQSLARQLRAHYEMFNDGGAVIDLSFTKKE